jgi:hypothetical protein
MRKKNYGWYRAPRTTQERRENGKRSKWGRAKRNSRNLVNSWDDARFTHQKTWKVKRRHQYRERGKEHTVFLPNDGAKSWGFWVNTWELEEYLNDKGIPFRLEKVEQCECRTQSTQRVYRCVGHEPYTYVRAIRPRKNGAKKVETRYETVTSYRSTYDWVTVKLAKPRTTRWSTLLGYRLTWWSDKDVGMERIIQRFINNHRCGETDFEIEYTEQP